MKTKKVKNRKELTKYLEVCTVGLTHRDAEGVNEVIASGGDQYWDCGTSSPEYRCDPELLAEINDLNPERLLVNRKVIYSDDHTVIEIKVDVLYGALYPAPEKMLELGIFTFRSVGGLESKLPKMNFAETSEISDRKTKRN